MKQFHYVIGYDTESRKWFIEHDDTPYFLGGNIYDGFNWSDPYGTDSEKVNDELFAMVESFIAHLPALVDGE